MVYGILFFLLIGITLEVGHKAMGMARITLGSVVNGISGSIDSMVYSTWKGINYIRSKAKTSANTQSANQANMRARQAECSKYWNTTLTQAQRDVWETYAAGLPIGGSAPGDIIKRAKGPFSGFTAFMRNNQLAFTADTVLIGAFVADAPIGIPGPDAPVGLAAAFAAGNITVEWAEGTVTGLRIRLWIRSQTVKGLHSQLITTALSADLTANLSAMLGRKGAVIPFVSAPGLYDVQADIVNVTGQVSPPSTIVRGVVVV